MSSKIHNLSENKLYRRVLLKLSGEVLMGRDNYGINPDVVHSICSDIEAVYKKNVEIVLVVGGGNIFRGVSGVAKGMDRVTADHMGMLATVINALAIQNGLETLGVPACVQSAIPMHSVCEPYIRRDALRHIQNKKVVIFAAGTGNPFFTTDTAAALRASEMGCDVLLKGTKVDGVYSQDPALYPDAEKYDVLDYKTVIEKDLKVMDMSAITLARDNNIPILVFSIEKPGNFPEVLEGNGLFTVVTNQK